MVERFEKFSYLITELSRLLHKIESDALSQFGRKGGNVGNEGEQ